MLSFVTVAKLIQALRQFKRRYNESWLIQASGFAPPNQARLVFTMASSRLDIEATCRRVG